MNAAITTANADIITVNANIAIVNADITIVNTNITIVNADIAIANADIAIAYADIATANANIATVNADIATANADIATANADIATVNADIAIAHNNILIVSFVEANITKPFKMMKKSVRVKVFRNAEELLNLANAIASKHQELGANSPLNPLDWTTQAPKVKEALELHQKAKELERQIELAYEQRDALLKGIDDITKQSRDLLKALYRKEPRKLGEFGFQVDDTPKVKKDK